MPLTIDLGVRELAATRFAISPLCETVSGLQLLGFGARPLTLRSWLRWARRELHRSGLALPTAWPLLMGSGKSYPEFVLPAPARAEPTLEEELLQMRQTRAAQVRASIVRVFGDTPPPAVAAVADAPHEQLRQVADELRAAYQLLIEPHWLRLRAVLAADIAYRARRLAIGGVERLFADLHRDVVWREGRIEIVRSEMNRSIQLGDRGLVLVPSVLIGDEIRTKMNSSTQTALRYPARGAATLWAAGLDQPRAGVARLLGTPRARLLVALRAPATTGALAQALQVTPSAVSQQLAVLRENGLVRSERAGRSVLHLATDLGLALLDPE